MKHKLYNRLLSLALAVGLVIGMLPSAAAVDTVGGQTGNVQSQAENTESDLLPAVNYDKVAPLEAATSLIMPAMLLAAHANTNALPPTNAGDSNGLILNKTVEDNGDGTYKINLEAYTTGQVISGETQPCDIILVLDMSTSMKEEFSSYTYTPVYSLNTKSTYYAGEDHVEVTWCSNCRKWTNGCYNTGGWRPQHVAGDAYTPKTGANDSMSGHVQFYSRRTNSSTTRLDALKQAATQFIGEVADQQGDHRVALVGFSDGAQYLGNKTANTALVNAKDNEQSLTSTINNISPGSYWSNGDLKPATDHDDGLLYAKNIIDNDTNPNRKKIVILFTDGEPEPLNEGDWSASIVKGAVNNALSIKNSGGAIYTISVAPNTSATGNTAMDKYMQYISSNYPKAEYTGYTSSINPDTIVSQVTPGTPAQLEDGESFYLTASDIDTLESIFGQIADQTQPDISLGSNSVVMDTVTPYFDLPSNTTDVTVQVADYKGNNAWGSPYTADGVQVTFTNEDNTKPDNDTVNVTGFDFDSNYITEDVKPNTANDRGKKLMISFTITPDPEFWGGNKVPTNVTETSGVAKGDGTIVENFPEPDPVDVPLKDISLTGKDVNVYYGGATPGAADLVTINPEYPDDWRTDYVDVTYTTEDTVSNTQDGSYTVTATLSPEYPGTYGNDTATANANVDVFKPEITWQDSTNEYGTELTNRFLAGHNAKTEWKHGTADSSSVTMFGNAPSLTYEFTDETGSPLPETLTQETHVKVTSVKSNDVVVPNVSFKWQAGAECSGCTDPNPTYQFRIHMATSHEDEYPVRFYLEGVGSGAPNYPFIDDWAKLDAVFSGGYVAIPSANTCVYDDDLVVPNGIHQASDTITGNNAVAQWLTDNQATPNLTVSDIKAALESLVKLGNLNQDTVLETVGNTQYTVADILASPEDFELRYTQVAENTDVIQEYYKGNRDGMYQQSYHVHLTVVRKPGDLTITKTFEGIDTPPTGFNIQVKDGNTVIETLTLGNADSNQNGTYTWTITDIPEATYTIIENGTDVTDMVLHATFDGATTSTGTTATIDVTGGVDKTVAITNSYSAADGTLNINKVVTGFANNGKPVFDFKLTAEDGTVYYYHVDMTGTAADQAKQVANVTLPVGEYTIEELSNQNYTLKSVEVGGSSIKNGDTITITPQGTTTVTFTNNPKDTNIPTDGSATENRVDQIDNGVIAWKPTPLEYGKDEGHNNINPDDDPAE